MCSFRECKPSEVGGCPCRLVAMNGGPLMSKQCAEVMGEKLGRIRSLEAMLFAKMRKAKQRWQDLLGGWPRHTSSTWDASDEIAPHFSEMEAQAMNKQITRRWKELGWK